MGDKDKFIFDSKSYEALLIELIESAQNKISLSFYIWEYDSLGKRVSELLQKKAQNGVSIEIILDGFGSENYIEQCQDILSLNPIEFWVYHPTPRVLRKIRSRISTFFRNFLWTVWNLNRRSHHKLVIVDEQKILTGSRNMHDEALNWRELSYYSESKQLVSEFCDLFELIKAYAKNPFLRKFKKVTRTTLFEHIISNHDKSHRKRKNRFLRDLIENSKMEILIATPYFLPDPRHLRLFRKKLGEGVKLQFLFSEISDIWLSQQVTRYFYGKLLSWGAEIYEYQKTPLHEKFLVADQRILFGTSNFNYRSRLKDLEVDLSIDDKDSLLAIKEHFEEGIQNAKAITKGYRQNVFLRAFIWTILKIFRRWM